MNYTQSIEINLPLEKVITLFDDPNNLYKWMKGLEKFEHLSGEPGQVGAKSKLDFKMGKRQMSMIETVLVRDLPNEFIGSYEVQSVYNIVRNRFKSIDQKKTLYTCENEFQFKGFMKLIAFLMPGMFKKQSYQYMIDFKKFAESEG